MFILIFIYYYLLFTTGSTYLFIMILKYMDYNQILFNNIGIQIINRIPIVYLLVFKYDYHSSEMIINYNIYTSINSSKKCITFLKSY